jgi:hypothetical protein
MEWHDLAGVRVPVASPSALDRTKDTYRPQDAIDRSFLHQLLERRRREYVIPQYADRRVPRS